jgi:hypothetical protein
LNPAYNNISARIKETREAIILKRRVGKKDSLLRRFVKYVRDAFSN